MHHRHRFVSLPSRPSTEHCILRFSISQSLYQTTGASTELDVVSNFIEIVPDTVIFDDFEKFQ